MDRDSSGSKNGKKRFEIVVRQEVVEFYRKEFPAETLEEAIELAKEDCGNWDNNGWSCNLGYIDDDIQLDCCREIGV